MKNISLFIFTLLFLSTGCVQNEDFTSSSIFDGANRMSFVDPENLYTFDYPDAASLAYGCTPVELHTITTGETTILESALDPNEPRSDCNGKGNGLTFTIHKAGSSSDVIQYLTEYTGNPRCGEALSMEDFPDALDEVVQVLPQNLGLIDGTCAELVNSTIKWNKTKEVLLISPGKSSAPYLFYGRDGDYEIKETLRFL